MLKRRLKTFILQARATLRNLRAWLRMRIVDDGDYLLPFPVYHATLQPQMSSTFSDEVHEFGDAVALRWSRDGCGIAAAKSAITTLRRRTDPTFSLPNISTLARELVDKGAYIEKIGWAHSGLVNLARSNGLHAENYVGESPVALCSRLRLGEIPIVSVTLYFRGGQRPDSNPSSKPRAKGGHLVVLKGFRWSGGRCVGFYVDDSQNANLPEGENSGEFVGIEEFVASYSKKVIYIRPPREHQTHQPSCGETRATPLNLG